MENNKICLLDNGHIAVTGDLSFNNVDVLWKSSQSLLNSTRLATLVIDLSAVSYSDSAGVALLVAWTRYMQRQAKALRFINLPKQMYAIACVCRLEKLLPIEVTH